MFDDEESTTTALAAVCPCGSGDDFGSCCGGKQSCDCGSEEPANGCCYTKDSDDTEYNPDEWN